MKFTKVIDFEDFTSNDLTPYFHAIANQQMPFLGAEMPCIQPDTVNWKTAIALYALEKNGLVQEGKIFTGIGAGTDRITEYLANRGAVVFPVCSDLASIVSSDVVFSAHVSEATSYSCLDANLLNIIPIHSDVRALALPSNFCDGVYCSESMEYLGSFDAIEAASFEIARILKPGGFASISIEFKLDGPEGLQCPNDQCILFTPDLIVKHIIESSGLNAIGALDFRPSESTFATRQGMVDFLISAKDEVTFRDRFDTYPNLIRFHDGFLFCSVHLLLKKAHDWKGVKQAQSKVDRFAKEIHKKKRLALNQSSANIAPALHPAQSNKIYLYWISVVLEKINLLSRKTPRLRRLILYVLLLFPSLHFFLKSRLNKSKQGNVIYLKWVSLVLSRMNIFSKKTPKLRYLVLHFLSLSPSLNSFLRTRLNKSKAPNKQTKHN